MSVNIERRDSPIISASITADCMEIIVKVPDQLRRFASVTLKTATGDDFTMDPPIRDLQAWCKAVLELIGSTT